MKVCPWFEVAANSWELAGVCGAQQASYRDGEIGEFTTAGCFSGQGEERDVSRGLFRALALTSSSEQPSGEGTELVW